MKSYSIKYQWFKIIKTEQVSAIDYAAAQLEFERTTQISKKFIIKIVQQ